MRMTSDEAPLRRGGGMKYAPLALPRRRLLFPALALGGFLFLLFSFSCASLRGSNAGSKSVFKIYPIPKESVTAPGLGMLIGKVTDKETGEGMIFVQISLLGTKIGGFTDDFGTYVIIHIPPGAYTVQAIRQDCKPLEIKKVEIQPDCKTYLDFKLKPIVIPHGQW